MHVQIEPHMDGIAEVRVTGSVRHAHAVHEISRLCADLHTKGRDGVILNLSACRRISMAGLAGLVELPAQNPRSIIALCHVPKAAKHKLRTSGLDRGLLVFDTLALALSDPSFESFQLRSRKATILCSKAGVGFSENPAIPLMDLAGRSLLDRMLDRLQGFGIRDCLLETGNWGAEFSAHFRAEPRPWQSLMFFQNATRNRGPLPVGQQTTPLGILAQLQENHAAFGSDFLVVNGCAFSEADLPKMFRAHAASGADVTVGTTGSRMAKANGNPGISSTQPSLMGSAFQTKRAPNGEPGLTNPAGIYIVSPRALEKMPRELPSSAGAEWHQQAFTAGLSVQNFSLGGNSELISGVEDFFALAKRVLAGEFPTAEPIGQKHKAGYWRHESAKIAFSSRISKTSYIGAHVQISKGVELHGTCLIGTGATVGARSVLENCIVMPGTRLPNGFWAENMIVHSDWSFDLSQKRSAPDLPALDVSQKPSQVAADQPGIARLWKTA